MLTSDDPQTIDQAELLGWQGLSIVCDTCRVNTILPFRMLRRQTRRWKLAEIAERLVCQRCKGRPASVALSRMHYRNGTPEPEEQAIR